MGILRRIENRLEGIFSGGFGRTFHSHVEPVEIARKLAKEMDDHRRISVQRVYVPNVYRVFLAPTDRARFASYEASLRAELAGYLGEHARREGYALVTRPKVIIESADELEVGTFGIAVSMEEPTSTPGSAQRRANGRPGSLPEEFMVEADQGLPPGVREPIGPAEAPPIPAAALAAAAADAAAPPAPAPPSSPDAAAPLPEPVAPAVPAAAEAAPPRPADVLVAAAAAADPALPAAEPEVPVAVEAASEPVTPAPVVEVVAPPPVAPAAPVAPPPALRPVPDPVPDERPLAPVLPLPTAVVAAVPPLPPVPPERLVLVGPGGRVPLDRRAVVIGRSRECDLVLHDGNVSRRHAELVRSGDGLVLRDLDSTNGTFVNGRRIREAPVGPGDAIVIGTSALRLERAT